MKLSLGKWLRRITGISTPVGGVSWEPPVSEPDEQELIRKLLLFLEDKRILYSPETGHSVASHFVFAGLNRARCLSPHAKAAILEIRKEIGRILAVMPKSGLSIPILKQIQATCRWALDVSDRMQTDVIRSDPDYSEIWGYGALDYGMTFLGLFRKKLARDIQELARQYQLTIEGPLQQTIELLGPLKNLDRHIFRQADALIEPYMAKHRGFKNMGPYWYEELCQSLSDYRGPWEELDR